MDQMVGVISLTIQLEMTSLALGTLMRSEIKPRLGGPGLTGFDIRTMCDEKAKTQVAILNNTILQKGQFF